MIGETQLSVGAASAVIVAILSFALPAEAGTCSPVMGKGRAADPATATTRAQHELIQRADGLGGKITQKSTNCKKVDAGYACKMTAVVRPKKS
jgi:hypothetical protein